MTKIITVSFFLLLLTTQAQTQGWKRYYSPPTGTFPTDELTIQKTPTNDVFILNEGHDQVLKLNELGQPSWIPLSGVSGWQTSAQIQETFAKDNIIAASDGHLITIDDKAPFIPTVVNLNYLHVAKYLPTGDTVWTKKHFITNSNFHIGDAIQLKDGNIVAIGFSKQSQYVHTIHIIKINYTSGNIIWEKQLVNTTVVGLRGLHILENDDQTLAFIGFEVNLMISNWYLTKLDSLGNKIWKQAYPSWFLPGINSAAELLIGNNLAKTSDGGYVTCQVEYNHTSGNFEHLAITKLDSLGNEEWKTWLDPDIDAITDLIVTEEDEIMVVGYKRPATISTGAIVKLKKNGTLDWQDLDIKGIGGSSTNLRLKKIVQLSKQEFVVVGLYTDSLGSKQIYAAKIDHLGNTNTILLKGTAYYDVNADCVKNNGESNVIQSTLLRFTSSTDELFVLTDKNGQYAIDLINGTYAVSAFSSSNYWQSCNNGIKLYGNTPIQNKHIGIQSLIDCPDLIVNISTPQLIRCFSNTYYVDYCNSGTKPANNTYVEVILDPYLSIDNSSIPYTANGQDRYIFQLGTVNAGVCGQFTFDITVSCNADLGQNHCVEAQIYPQDICLPTGNWTGANITTNIDCLLGDSIEIRIKNAGTTAMTHPRNYYFLRNDNQIKQGSFQLAAGQELVWKRKTDADAIYQIRAQQAISHPQPDYVSTDFATYCHNSNISTTNIINQFTLGDQAHYVDKDCQQNVGSYDPNDKQGFPKGYGPQHYIEQDDQIEYLIRFQNTGTYTAFNVVIKDTIDFSAFDITSLQIQNSSHPYELSVVGSTLVFTFENIMLPDSATNEPASHGFIRFKINQQPNLPIGTIIENSTAIYFDYNEPIITNTTFHEIGNNFVQVVSTHDEITRQATVNVFPNPFSEQANFEIITNINIQTFQLLIYDSMGKIVQNLTSESNNELILTRKGLTTGYYFYRLLGDGVALDSGKLLVR